MQKSRDIEIDENNPFQKDLLKRKTEIENLTPIVLNFNDPLVLALDSPWGTGKTTFVKLWQAYLQKEEENKPSMQSIYFNAWETDFAEDPLIVLVSEFDKWLKSNNNESKITNWTRGLKATLPGIAKRSAVVATKVVTFGSLDIGAEYERTAAEFTGNIASDLLDKFYKESKSIQLFKSIIADALKALPEKQKNLVIFIDELDRCRPTYAIELLERIKHLFSIERLVFVLSTDKEQLAHSIRAVYGNEFDAKKYLQRFIDFDYSLKKPDIENYIEIQLRTLEVEKYYSTQPHDEFSLLNDSLSFLSKRFSLKLRDINLLLFRLRLILCSAPLGYRIDSVLLVTLLIIREYRKDLYDKYVESPLSANEIISFIADSSKEKQSNDLLIIATYLIAPILYEESNYNLDRFFSTKELKITNVDDIEKIKQFIRDGKRFQFEISRIPIIEKIELLHKIDISR